MKIAVAGASGRVGCPLVDVLREGGHEVVPMSRTHGVDVISKAGLAEALAGVDGIVDVASGPSPDEQEATAFFTTAARNLHDEGGRAGVRRMVVVSIIGIDDAVGGYNVAKRVHEKAALDGPIPTRIVRAAQFHEFVEQMMAWSTRGDTAYLPTMRTQLVAARAVAEELAALATADDATFADTTVREVAGPREESLAGAARLLAARRGHPTTVEEVSDPANPDRRLFEDGSLLPGPGAVLAGPTFAEWLADQG
jgi:uncharacterized protein YbjT (DUF2867 family)